MLFYLYSSIFFKNSMKVRFKSSDFNTNLSNSHNNNISVFSKKQSSISHKNIFSRCKPKIGIQRHPFDPRNNLINNQPLIGSTKNKMVNHTVSSMASIEPSLKSIDFDEKYEKILEYRKSAMK